MNLLKIKKKLIRLQKITATVSLLGLIGFLTSFIILIWFPFIMFIKMLLTSIMIILIGMFFNKIIRKIMKEIN